MCLIDAYYSWNDNKFHDKNHGDIDDEEDDHSNRFIDS